MKRITYILLPLLFGIYTYRYHNLYFNLVLCLVLFFTLLNALDWFITHRMVKQKGLQTKFLILSLSLRFILALYGVVLIKKYFYPKKLIFFAKTVSNCVSLYSRCSSKISSRSSNRRWWFDLIGPWGQCFRSSSMKMMFLTLPPQLASQSPELLWPFFSPTNEILRIAMVIWTNVEWHVCERFHLNKSNHL